jgi:hypothetical protein
VKEASPPGVHRLGFDRLTQNGCFSTQWVTGSYHRRHSPPPPITPHPFAVTLSNRCREIAGSGGATAACIGTPNPFAVSLSNRRLDTVRAKVDF